MLYKDLFEYLNQEHGLTILESDALEIERIVLKNQENQQLLLNGVVKSFYCQKPTDYKSSFKCETQCGLCASFEGKRQ